MCIRNKISTDSQKSSDVLYMKNVEFLPEFLFSHISFEHGYLNYYLNHNFKLCIDNIHMDGKVSQISDMYPCFVSMSKKG